MPVIQRRACGQQEIFYYPVYFSSLVWHERHVIDGCSRTAVIINHLIIIHPRGGPMNKELYRPQNLTPQNLAIWLPRLYGVHKEYLFYKTPEWKRLRKQILEANHYECEDCRAKSPTKITPAVTVHHDREVEKFPELALSMYWIDGRGHRHQQLFALCEDCHNARHNRFGYGNGKEKEKPLTEERW